MLIPLPHVPHPILLATEKNSAHVVTVPEIIPDVPFYSQFKDITSVKWQKVGCGVASLAMVIDYYTPTIVSVNKLLSEAVASGAYQNNAGWTHQGLVSLSKKYGLDGKAYDLSKLSSANAFSQFSNLLKNGPIIVSVHYKFDVKSTIPHLVVIDGIRDDVVYYNDPAAKSGEKTISVDDFKNGWKKRFIVIRPVKNNSLAIAE
jgi:ABC-type bacteriocin/lantibiotic exporter with double-glycine peptidase domain